MPELPEVEVVRRKLSEVLVGGMFTGVSVLTPCVLLKPADVFSTGLLGLSVSAVNRFGKCLQIFCANESALLIHLRMTGQLIWNGSPIVPDGHTHVIWSVERPGRSKGFLAYRDVRKFGRIDWTESRGVKASEILLRFGPDVLELDLEAFSRRVRKFRAQIKAVLLNQAAVAGLGNIYADEILFEAGVHPRTLSSGLGDAAVGRLFQATRRVLNCAIRFGGSSLRDYIHIDGSGGSYQTHHRVYGRAGQPCVRCQSEIHTAKIAGRTSAFCPRCQSERKAA